ncbi:unnamed protein product [Durusdinium trenchii]|uniref:RNA-editing substrate-binding complex 6 protein domain-containing protein n=1 Tax=Durusdinium trenchii TaxID=1381693 RepID=A0ABP0M867_9DINO
MASFDAFERGFAKASLAQDGVGVPFTNLLQLLPNKEWVPFGHEALSVESGAFGTRNPNVQFYLKPSLMPICGSVDLKTHVLYQKDLAFLKKDGQHEVRINKEISSIWTAKELLNFAHARSTEFDLANVVTVLHRIAKSADRWQMKRDARLGKIVAQAVDVLGEDGRTTPRDIAKTQWAIGRLHAQDAPVQEKLNRAIARRMSEFEAQGLSNVIWGLAFAEQDAACAMRLALLEFHQRIGECDPQALSNVAWSIAKSLAAGHEPLLLALSSASIARVKKFDPQGLANLSWSFATLQQHDPVLFARVGETFLSSSSTWEPQHIANFLWSCARCQVESPPLLAGLCAASSCSLDTWTCQGLANLAWSLAKLERAENSLLERIITVLARKIRRCSPQNTVNLAWSFAKLLAATSAVLELLASQTTRTLAEFSPQHCSNLSWAFATMSHMQEPLMMMISFLTQDLLSSFAVASCVQVALFPFHLGRHMLECKEECHAQDIASLLWSCAKLAWQDQALLKHLCASCIVKVESFSAQHMAMCTWALGCLTLPQQELMHSFARQLPRSRGEIGTQGISNLAHGLGKQALRDEDFLDFLSQEASGSFALFTNQEFAMTLWAFAKLHFLSPPLVAGACQECLERRPHLLPQDLVVLSWAFARLDVGWILSAMSAEVQKSIPELGPQDLANVSWAFAAAQVEDAPMMSSIAQEARRQILELEVQDVSNISWAFAKFGLRDAHFFEVLAERVSALVGCLLPQNLSILCWSFAKLELQKPKLITCIMQECWKHVDQFDSQGVSNLIWSLAVLAYDSPSLCQRLSQRAICLVHEMTAQEMANIAWGLHVLQHGNTLQCFLQHSIGPFSRMAVRDGAAWVDFVNVCLEAQEASGTQWPRPCYVHRSCWTPDPLG